MGSAIASPVLNFAETKSSWTTAAELPGVIESISAGSG